MINSLDENAVKSAIASLRSTADVPEKTHGVANGGSASLQILAYLPDVYLKFRNYRHQLHQQTDLAAYYKKMLPFSVRLIDLLMKIWYLEDGSHVENEIDSFDRRYLQQFRKLDVNRPGDANAYLSAIILLSIEDGDGSEKKESQVIDFEKLFCFKSKEAFVCQCGVASSKEVAMIDLKARFPVLASGDSLAWSDLCLEKMIHPPASVTKYCHNCSRSETYQRETKIAQLPQVVCVTILRSESVEASDEKSQPVPITERVNVPLELDFAAFMDAKSCLGKDANYELVAFAVCESFSFVYFCFIFVFHLICVLCPFVHS
jgi:hypothetical protein